jgi:hypothetical protein
MRTGRARAGVRQDERFGEAGETLVEVLMTITIIGVAFVAVFGAIFTALRVSDYHRKTTTADVVLRNFAEQVKAPLGAYQYVPCTAPGGTSYPAYTPPEPHEDYTATITQIRYLSGYASDAPTWSTTCPGTDLGAQELTLQAKSPSDPAVEGDERVVVIKRDAAGDNWVTP